MKELKEVIYPCWLYKGKETVLVKSAEEHKALGDGYKDSPHDILENPHCPQYQPESPEAETKAEEKKKHSSKS